MVQPHRWPRLFFALAAAALALVVAPAARAQSVTINAAGVTRDVARGGSTSINQYWISQSDCVQDDVLHFPLSVDQYSGYQLQAWVGGAGTDCTTYEARNGSTATCWLVWQGTPVNNIPVVDVRVRDLVGQHKPSSPTSGPGSGTVEDCEGTQQGSPDPQSVTINFLFVSSGQYAGQGSKWDTKYDLVGPNAPGAVSAGIGDTILVLGWNPSVGQTDLAGYNLYCDVAPSGSSAGVLDAATDAPQVTLPPCPDAAAAPPPDGGSDADLDAGSDADLDADLDASPADADVADAVDLDACTPVTPGPSDDAGQAGSTCSPNLTPGVVPEGRFLCGQITNATAASGILETDANGNALVNGVTVSVAVAAFDLVGNVGPLSNVTCTAPEPVDDFFRLYREAGGTGGGGYCDVGGGVGRAAGGAGLLGAALALAFVSVRRARRTGR